MNITLDNNIAFNTPDGAFYTDANNVTSTNLYTQDPGMGSCLVYPPPGSFAAQHGIGATILFRYQNGTLTSNPLWDPTTSRFTGCGQTVNGVNDTAGNSCINVHQRLNVNANGCTIPNSGMLPAPTNLRVLSITP
jgi:hypothetical protein